jgi:hypothetical protein
MIHYNIPYISVQQNFGTIHKDDRDTVYVYTTGAFDDRAHIGSNILHDTLQHTAVRAPSVLGIAVSMGRSLFTNTLEKRPRNDCQNQFLVQFSMSVRVDIEHSKPKQSIPARVLPVR